VSEDQSVEAERRFAYLLLFLVPAMFTCNQVMARVAPGLVPPVALAFWRWVTTALLLLPFVGPVLWRERATVRAEAPRLFVLGVLGMALCGAPVYVAGHTTSVMNIGLIYAAAPIGIVALDRFAYGGVITARQVAGIGLSLLGVVYIVLRGDVTALAGFRFVVGDLWMVLATVAWALYSVWLKHWPTALAPAARLAVMAASGALALLPILLIESTTQPIALNATTIGVVLLVALVPGLGAFWGFSKTTAILGPARTALINYLPPVYNAFAAWLVIGERVEVFHLVGGALILPGVWLATRTE